MCYHYYCCSCSIPTIIGITINFVITDNYHYYLTTINTITILTATTNTIRFVFTCFITLSHDKATQGSREPH